MEKSFELATKTVKKKKKKNFFAKQTNITKHSN